MLNIESTRISKPKTRPARVSRPLAPYPFGTPNLHPLSPEKAREYLDFLQAYFEPVPSAAPAPHDPFLTRSLSALGGVSISASHISPQLQEQAEADCVASARIRLRLRDPVPDPDAMPAFITSSVEQPGFPVALAQFLALHCDHSYRKPLFPTGSNPSVPSHFLRHHQRAFDRDHAQGLGFVFERHAFLVFRGSESLVDWLRNLKMWQKADHGGKNVRVHRGFQQNLDLLWDEVNEWRARLPPVEGVILSGHSLGGAMTILAAHRLRLADEQVTSVITFGSPRVGGEGFAESYAAMGLEERSWRVIWGADLVTKLPPPLGYRHVGQAIPIASPRQLEGDLLKGPLVGQSNDLWRTVSLLLSARNPLVYGALYSLPFATGLMHSGREHMRSLGYSFVHRTTMDRRLESVLDALEISDDELSREVLVQMHRCYFCGGGVGAPTPLPQRDEDANRPRT